MSFKLYLEGKPILQNSAKRRPISLRSKMVGARIYRRKHLSYAPMVPMDLSCLKGCFDKYLDKSYLLTEIQKTCSEIGLDRQVPTQTKEGYDLVQSNYSDLVNWPDPTLDLPLNPNLDCLVYFETKERNGCRNDGVCNFIQQQTNPEQRQSGIQKLNPDIVTYITYYYDYRSNILRASSPVERARGFVPWLR